MSPSRRTVLRGSGIVLSAAVGGCLSSDAGSPTSASESSDPNTTDASADSATVTESSTASEPPEVREVNNVDRGVPSALTGKSKGDRFLELAVGSREGVSNPDNNKPHVAEVWNETEDALTVDITLITDGETVLDERYEFDARTSIALDLRKPRHYELTVSAGDREDAAEVERERFDCNDSATDSVIRNDEIESGWITTELACKTTN